MYTYVKHDTSGDVYACETDDAGTIVRALGPIHHTTQQRYSPGTCFAVAHILYRSSVAAQYKDGTWLRNEPTSLVEE